MDDFYFLNDGSGCSQGTIGNAWMGSNIDIIMSNYYIDGNALNYRTTNGYNPGIALNISGGGQGPTFTSKYGVMIHWALRPFISPYGTTPGPNITWEGSWVEGWDYSIAPNAHTEWWVGASGGTYQNNVNIDHTIMIQDGNGPMNFGPAPVQQTFSYPVGITSFNANYDVMIDAAIGGGTYSATVSGCIGSSISSLGVCSGTGPNFYVTRLTGTIGTGETFNCPPPRGSFIQLYQQTGGAGSGYLAVWSFDEIGHWAPASDSTSCTNVRVRNYVGGDSGFLFANDVAPAGTYQVTHLYGDFASTPVWSWMHNGGFTSLPGATISSGGVLTTTSAITAQAGNPIYAADIPGCSGVARSIFLGCPTIATNTRGTTFTLNNYTGSGNGPETIQWWQPSYCLVPAVFNNNVDMSGTLNNTQMNYWSSGGDFCRGAR